MRAIYLRYDMPCGAQGLISYRAAYAVYRVCAANISRCESSISQSNQNRPGVRAALTRIEGGNDKEESLLVNRLAGGVTRSPFDDFSITVKCVKNALSV